LTFKYVGINPHTKSEVNTKLKCYKKQQISVKFSKMAMAVTGVILACLLLTMVNNAGSYDHRVYIRALRNIQDGPGNAAQMENMDLVRLLG
jgi:hypothetical protein